MKNLKSLESSFYLILFQKISGLSCRIVAKQGRKKLSFTRCEQTKGCIQVWEKGIQFLFQTDAPDNHGSFPSVNQTVTVQFYRYVDERVRAHTCTNTHTERERRRFHTESSFIRISYGHKMLAWILDVVVGIIVWSTIILSGERTEIRATLKELSVDIGIKYI